MSNFLDALAQRVIIYDGAMGTNIQRYQLTAEDYGGAATEGCNEYLVLTRPAIIEEIQAGFLEVGCDVLETDSFTASRLKLDEYGIGHLTHEVNFAAAQLARRLADSYSTPGQPRFVAGSIGPTGMLPSSDDPLLSNITYRQLVEIFREQAHSLLLGGVDLLLIETSQDILEVRAAITGLRRAMQEVGRQVPIQAQVSLDTSGRMLLGTDIGAVMTTLTALRVDIIGLNCSTGPEHMREPVRFLAENCPLPISTIPNAGIPLNVNGQAVYPMEPEPMAQALREFITEFGVNIVGGCCGSSHEHLRAIVNACRPVSRHPRPIADKNILHKDFTKIIPPLVSSGIRSVSMQQDPAPLLVGERVNSTGSRKAKQALLADDYDTLLAIGREQVEGGAHVLDVQVALTERTDEAAQMAILTKKLSMGVEAPLVIDSTEAPVLQAALEIAPGRVIINSINMETGRQRIESVLPLALEHGSAVIALTIDEIGMGKTIERKVEIAQKIYDICVNEYQLPPTALIFDPLTFPITTGQEELQTAGVETLTAITRIKAEMPGVMTILGVSNVSFGLKQHARKVLNSVFLYHAVQAGLDMAIVNPTHITPYAEIDAEQRQLADDLIFNREDALPRYIAYFEAHGPQKDEGVARVDPTEGMNAAEKIHWQILHRRKEGVEPLIDEVIAERSQAEGWSTGDTAVNVLNTVLLPAMKDVGDRFGAGELILPFVLQSAEVMKRSVAHLEKYLEKQEGYTKGKIVLATVFGDVHDIGKNLVNTILSNNGYTVYDLGKQVPLNTILDKAVEVNADAIGLSALLVSTSKQMPLCVKELHKRNLKFPVIIGGAAINRSFGRRILFVDEQTPESTPQIYDPGVFYARDAFEGLDIIDKLTNAPTEKARFVERIQQEALAERTRKAARPEPVAPVDQAAATKPSESIKPLTTLPTPPFWGPRVLERIGLEDIAVNLDLNALYRGRWGGTAHGAEFTRLVEEEFQPRLERMLREARQQRYLQPRMIYGYYPCQSSGNELIIYDPQPFQQTSSGTPELREISRFGFPRQTERERLCLADYFASVESGQVDVVAFQVVTMGEPASEAVQRAQQAGDYSEAYFIHGLSVQMTEAMADYANNLIKQELKLEEPRGRRYSWGYAAIPDLADHEKLFQLLPVRETINVDLTESYQLVPEQTTAAIVIHHPQSVYFAVRTSSAETAAV
ncbi:methionine synthase [Tengunoibacter tsumagoiensis]|uniref:Methionine synthase n=1 Tax=Tengunoibacter tsumagoiensis TaxID=2014871 RepID=A0A402A2W4_9CHLR|nr:methionine synthase [Tengunoibacter tsumagoiensis]GCE13386.1 methionine synthase [Tengunoibacter tsumagoiensis]